MQAQALTIAGDQMIDIILGAIFVFIGLAAYGVAGIRRRSGVRIFVWLGTWSALYGATRLADSPAFAALLPRWLQVNLPYLETAATYLILPVAVLALLELTLGKMRIFAQAVIFAGLAIGLAGVGFFIFTGSNDKLIPYNNLLAAYFLIVLITVVAVPGLSREYLVIQDRGVLVVGTLVFAVEALYDNLARPLGYRSPHILSPLGFAVLLWSLGYVALRMTFANERRLVSIDNELAIAREIQNSILPRSVPEIGGLRIAASYHPMTAVAGDFYEFIPLDQNRAGILIADVSGHGVPAALIAAMIKVAMQSVVSCADDPARLLGGLSHSLAGQLRGQFVTAAYLWIDTQNRKAFYSAAGHPPLFRWRDGALEQIASNGMPIGLGGDSDYPVVELPVKPGDRFLLYTDGVTEPQNAAGEFFGDNKFEQVLRKHRSLSALELSNQLLAEIRRWQPASTAQQDDITLIVIDVV